MSLAMRLHRLADTGLLVEVADLDAVLALDAAVRAAIGQGDPRLAGVLDVLPAACTLVLTVAPGVDLGAVEEAVRGLDVTTLTPEAGEAPVVEIPVVYDGPDLDDVARFTGLTEAEVVAAHTGTPWRAAFGGFAPGFFYLVEGDPRLAVPRRSEPRTAVPDGAVALAGSYSAVYPRRSPGGWQLLGHTNTRLWDAERTPPALLSPGTLVRFVDAGGSAATHTAVPARAEAPDDTGAPEEDTPAADPTPAEGAERAVEILATGPRALVQDLGRPGLARLGVGRSGAADRAAHALAQRLVGNTEEAAGIEVTLGGFAMRARGDLLAVVTGAPVTVEVEGRPRAPGELLHLADGADLRLGTAAAGLRAYVAVRGGLEAPVELGSRSTDTLSGLGPAPLAEGDVLPVGESTRALPTLDAVALPPPPSATEVRLRVRPGPRLDWIASPEALVGPVWHVSSRSDRIGVRLDGEPVARESSRTDAELPSEGVVRGSIQVPAGGEPVLFLADHPVTGGYPVAAVVVSTDVDRAAQLRPGDRVRFVWDAEAR